MGRKPTITRDAILAVAEAIVNNEGPQALTIAAVAKAVGVSKGGVQYSFSSKDELVSALVERWTSQFDELLVVDDAQNPTEFVRSYMDVMQSSQGVVDAKMAGLLIVYMLNPKNRRETLEWYRTILNRIGASKDARAARVAFLALEGLMLMRISGVKDGVEWQDLLDDIDAILGAENL